MNGTTWAETSLLLTTMEIPGIYVDLNSNLVYAFDQVGILDMKKINGKTEITVKNPTHYDASVKILAESANEQKSKHKNSFLNWFKVDKPSEKTLIVKL